MFFMANLFSQSGAFKVEALQSKEFSNKLDLEFKSYSLYQLDLPSIDQYVQSNSDAISLNLKLGNLYDWNINLYPKDIRSEDYQFFVQKDSGVEVYPKRPNMTYRGYLNEINGGKAGFTINDHHFAGTVEQDDQLYFIEPLHYLIKDAPRDIVVVYAIADVKPHEGLTCGADEFIKKSKNDYGQHDDHDHSPAGDAKMVDLCLEVELAIASDWLMYLDYNENEMDVEDHNITVMNNVATNWDDEFDDEIVFVIVTQFISTCNTCDPWTSSTNASTLLSSFRSWGNGGGFGVTFDLGQLWTDRDLNGGTIGIAYVGAVCGSFRYHVLQDFSTNQQLLRVLTSHEIGHNFDALHDASGSGFIMAPSVNTSNTWSTSSQNSINSYIANEANCLAECVDVLPPDPDFVANQTTGCVPLDVQFTDLTINSPSQWLWSFPGGIPATSTAQNPLVTYTTAGNYDVTLTATNSAGSNTTTKFSYVVPVDIPFTNFSHTTNEDLAIFTNNSINATSYNWDFGDGTSSTESSPIHFYMEDGMYTVTLTASNSCGVSMFTDIVTIATLPVPNFISNEVSGCAPLAVAFEDLSSANTDFWLWEFPGASPDQSAEQNPIVAYETPGTYDVTLTVINEVGSNTITIENYITIDPLPIPDFTSIVDGQTVNFTNTSTDATSYSWDFGDGSSSTEENPAHTYDDGGTYFVELTAINSCGELTTTIEIEIAAPPTAPTAGFGADVIMGCAALTVNFSDNSSSNVEAWDWSFPGGTPSSSTEQNPTVVYNSEGTYDVTLIVTNAVGADTLTEVQYIDIDDVPMAGFTSSVNEALVDFTNTSTEATSYSWDFGDSNTSTEESPSHTYDMDGTYTVILTATNACGSVMTEEEITIVTPPVAGFSANTTSGCADLTVAFSDESTANATSWEWTFEGGTPSSSTAQNPSVEYTTAGMYTVTLEVTNAAGTNTVSETNYIVVDDVPMAGFTSSVNDALVDFTNTSTEATSYSWDFGDSNTSTEESPSHTYDMDGTYTVILTATNACGSVMTEEEITIVTPPVAGFSANTTSGCADLTVAFSDESTANATSWEWTFEGGTPSSSTAQNPSVEYTTAGMYTVTLEVTNAAGTNTVSETNYIVVDDVPMAGFTSSVNEALVDFTNTSTEATSYSWDFGDSNTSTEESPSHTYDMDGTYTVILTATNACGSVMTEEEITIVTPPVAGFSANTTSGCADLTVAFSDESTANATSWEWTFEGGTPSSSTAQNPSVEYTTAGMYTVTLEVTNAAGTNTVSETNYIVVDDVPMAGFTSSVNEALVDFTNTSTEATSYSWDFGDSNTSTEESPSHTYDMDGTYTVILTATNACGSVMTEEEITIVTPPVAGFSANTTSGCADLTVAFSDESTANATSWEWTFEGGTPSSSTAQNPSVEYTTAGMYTVTLEVTNAAGTNTVSETNYIVVDDVPMAGFTSAVNDALVDFTNTSMEATSYSWDFGDSNTSTEENPSHTYDMDGTYTVILTATNVCGSVEVMQEVNIGTLPTASFNSNITSGCGPLTVMFSDLSSANTTEWEWVFEGGTPATSAEQNPTVVFEESGMYSVTLTAINDAGNNTITQTNYITVNTVPDPSFMVASAGAVVSFTNTSINATSISWDFGDGNGSTEDNPIHTYDMDGDYEVVLTTSNECGSSEVTQTVTAVIAPVAGFSANTISGCAPLSVEFMDQSSGTVESYSWSFPGGTPSSSTVENPVVVYETPGTYTVELEVTNVAGSNTAVQTNYITVNTVPAAGFNGTVTGNSIDLINTSTGATGFTWDFGDGNNSNDTNPSHDFDMDGEYIVTLTAENECGTTTYTETFEIVTEPLAGFNADVTTGCADLTVNFMDQSSENTTSWEWTFEGGNPSSSTEQNPMVLYNTPGSYNVTLVASTSAGSNTYTQNQFIVVNTVPSVDFSSNINGATVNFLNNSTGATSYSWDFGDSNMSTMANPEHTYANDGDYTVTLTAINECGETSTTQSISIVSLPVATFSASVTAGCGPLNVDFTDASTGNVSNWNWSFPGGTPSSSTEQHPNIEYTTPGVYSVTLEVTNSVGTDITSIFNYIVIEALPQPDFDATITGSTAIFSNMSTGGTSYHWDFGDGNESIEENPFHIYDTDGTYTVVLMVTNSCGTVTTSQVVLIITPPTAFFAADTLSGCVPLTVQYTNQSSENATAYLWTFEGGAPATSTEENPLVTYNSAGTFDVTLTVMNPAGNGTATEMDYIIIGDEPTAGFTSVVSGTVVEFTNTSSNGDTYEWDFDDGGMSMEANPIYEYLVPGDYEVTLIVTNACGSSIITQTISIDGEVPVAGFNADATNGCLPFTVNFEDTSTGDPTVWSWSFPGGDPVSSSEQNPTVIYNAVGTYEVSLTVTNDFGENTVSETEYIVVEDVPTAGFDFDIMMDGTVEFTNTSTGGTTYDWDFGNTEMSMEESPIYQYTESGMYTVVLTATNSCGSSTTEMEVDITITGIEDFENIDVFNLFPNPNDGQFTLVLEGQGGEDLQLRLFNVLGQNLYSEGLNFNGGRWSKTYDFELAAGTYVLQLRSGNKVLYKKVIME